VAISEPNDPGISAVFDLALASDADTGATVIDVDTGDPFLYFDDELTVLLFESSGHGQVPRATPGTRQMRTLGRPHRVHQCATARKR